MSTRRVVLGRRADGTYGMRCALPGKDALTADANDADALSFNSDWTNLLKVHLIGIAAVPQIISTGFSVTILFPALGYVPYAEARSASGSVVYDDLLVTLPRPPNGNTTAVITNLMVSVLVDRLVVGRNVAGLNVLYAVYKERAI